MPKLPSFARFCAVVFFVSSAAFAKAEFTGLTYDVVASTAVGTTYRIYANFDAGYGHCASPLCRVTQRDVREFFGRVLPGRLWRIHAVGDFTGLVFGLPECHVRLMG